MSRPPGRVRVLADGTLVAGGITLRELIREAYGHTRRSADDLIGTRGWIERERYDVVVTLAPARRTRRRRGVTCRRARALGPDQVNPTAPALWSSMARG